MEMPVEIDFQGMQGSSAIRQSIDAHIAKLEEVFGRIISCRIDVRAPTPHHHTGAPYQIHVRLTLPDGSEINIARREAADEREADFAFALNHAFKRARRALQDRVRRMRGDVKRHRQNPALPVVSARKASEPV
jgi:ribosome-associated translation inhibitor RaiA